MALIPDFDDNGIGPDFNATQVNAASGSDYVTLVADRKSMVVDNDEPVSQLARKAPHLQGRYVSYHWFGGSRNLVGPIGIGKKWITTFLGARRKNEHGTRDLGFDGLGRRLGIGRQHGEEHHGHRIYAEDSHRRFFKTKWILRAQ